MKSTTSLRICLRFCEILPQLRCAIHCFARSEILHLEELANLDLAFIAYTVEDRYALGPLDRFFPRVHLDDPVPSDQLLGLGERPVDHHLRSSRKLDARCLRTGLESGELDQYAGLSQILRIVSDRGNDILAGSLPRFTVPAGFNDQHELHLQPPFLPGLHKSRIFNQMHTSPS